MSKEPPKKPTFEKKVVSYPAMLSEPSNLLYPNNPLLPAFKCDKPFLTKDKITIRPGVTLWNERYEITNCVTSDITFSGEAINQLLGLTNTDKDY